MTDIKDKVEEVPVDKIIKYMNNPKAHPSDQIDKIASSIKNYGFDQPIVVDAENEIIKGHGRLEAAKKLGLDKVPVIKQENLSEAQVRGARLADNKTAESEWLDEELALEFDELDDMDFDLELTGFGDDEISEVLDGQKEAEEDDFVADVNEDEEPEAERGQIYRLGEHRLMCGDATEEGDVDALMDGAKADMVFTDPPYNVEYTGGMQFTGNSVETNNRNMIENDDKDIYRDTFRMLSKYVKYASYIWFADAKGFKPYKYAEQYGEIHSLIIWVKDGGYGALNANYKQKHEPCLYWKPKGGKLNFNGDTTETTVWEISKDGVNEYHPTQKPVKLAARAIGNHSAKSILDLFGGSGSTLIAAEQLDRKCYMMEIDPHYVDVIIDRWEEYTGDTAELVS